MKWSQQVPRIKIIAHNGRKHKSWHIFISIDLMKKRVQCYVTHISMYQNSSCSTKSLQYKTICELNCVEIEMYCSISSKEKFSLGELSRNVADSKCCHTLAFITMTLQNQIYFTQMRTNSIFSLELPLTKLRYHLWIFKLAHGFSSTAGKPKIWEA